MSIRSSIGEELKRTPVAAVSGAVSAVIAALSLLLAWIQYSSATVSSGLPSIGNVGPRTEFFLGNVFLVTAYFLAITVATALLLRSVARVHDHAAFFGSIPMMALTNFSVILIMYLAPPRPITPELFESAHNLVFYASAATVFAICGKAVLVEIGRSARRSDAAPDGKSGDAGAFLFISVILLAAWCWLVFAGQTRLADTLLPEITHPSTGNTSKGRL